MIRVRSWKLLCSSNAITAAALSNPRNLSGSLRRSILPSLHPSGIGQAFGTPRSSAARKFERFRAGSEALRRGYGDSSSVKGTLEILAREAAVIQTRSKRAARKRAARRGNAPALAVRFTGLNSNGVSESTRTCTTYYVRSLPLEEAARARARIRKRSCATLTDGAFAFPSLWISSRSTEDRRDTTQSGRMSR